MSGSVERQRSQCIIKLKRLLRLHLSSLYPIYDGRPVRTILANRYPQRTAVKIKPAGVINAALSQPKVLQQHAIPVKPEQVPDALTGVPVELPFHLSILLGPALHFYSSEKKIFPHPHQSLSMMRIKAQADGVFQLPPAFRRNLPEPGGKRFIRGLGTD